MKPDLVCTLAGIGLVNATTFLFALMEVSHWKPTLIEYVVEVVKMEDVESNYGKAAGKK